jgi:hypothetical protein
MSSASASRRCAALQRMPPADGLPAGAALRRSSRACCVEAGAVEPFCWRQARRSPADGVRAVRAILIRREGLSGASPCRKGLCIANGQRIRLGVHQAAQGADRRAPDAGRSDHSGASQPPPSRPNGIAVITKPTCANTNLGECTRLLGGSGTPGSGVWGLCSGSSSSWDGGPPASGRPSGNRRGRQDRVGEVVGLVTVFCRSVSGVSWCGALCLATSRAAVAAASELEGGRGILALQPVRGSAAARSAPKRRQTPSGMAAPTLPHKSWHAFGIQGP